MKGNKIGFLGAGEMGRAIARGLIRSQLVKSEEIWISDPNLVAVQAFSESVTGCRIAQNNADLVRSVDLVIFAVKPQHIGQALAGIGDELQGKPLVSIVAGVNLATLSELVRSGRIIRVMPNTPCLIGAGATAYSRGPDATAADIAWVDQIFSALGVAVEVNESQLDVVTGLSGSGPAYVFSFIQALADGGVLMGLPRTTAHTLAVETVIGAARLVRETGEHPASLSDRVASAGGTTIHGLDALDQQGFRAAVMAAVRAATLRSRELSRSN